jgi:Ca2+-binding RTX toxin-like protein
MAVTKSYSLTFVQNLNLTQGPGQSETDVVGLANGGFAATSTRGAGTDLDVFNSALADAGGTTSVSAGTKSALDQLNNGNLVVVTLDGNSARYAIRTAAGGLVVADTDLSDGAIHVDVAGLAQGNFVIASASGGNGMNLSLRNNAGALITNITVPTGVVSDPSIAALDDGGFAIAWTVTLGGTGIWYTVYNGNGSVRKGITPVDEVGAINQTASVAAMNGGFVVVFSEDGWGTGGNDITLKQYNATGTVGPVINLSNPSLAFENLSDTDPYITRLDNGLMAIAYTRDAIGGPGNGNTIVKLYDPASGTVVAQREVPGTTAPADVEFPALAGLGLGRVAVFHTENNGGFDINGQALQVVRTSTGDAANNVIVGDSSVDIMSGNGGNDSLVGGSSNDTLSGGIGNDTLVGGLGTDVLRGDAGNDVYALENGSDNIVDSAGIDSMTSTISRTLLGSYAEIENLTLLSGNINGTGNNINNLINGSNGLNMLTGGIGNDVLRGQGGVDVLIGGAGVDTLAGGAQSDYFLFNVSVIAANRDVVTDFSNAAGNNDTFRLENAVFTKVGAPGLLKSTAFKLSTQVKDADDRIIYNKTAGVLSYDPDGSGAAGAVHFATLITKPTLTFADFVVV